MAVLPTMTTTKNTFEHRKEGSMVIRMDTEDVMMSTEDMAKIIPLTKEVFVNYIKKGILPGFRIERRYFVYSSDFYKWLETKRVNAEPIRDNTYYNTEPSSEEMP